MHPTETPRSNSHGLLKRISLVGLAAVTVIHTTSCGFIVSGSQTISLNSDPQGAEVKMDGMTQGVTPTNVRVSRRDEPIFIFEKEGYQTVQKATERKPNTYFVLDIIGGVLILVPFIGLLGAGDWDIDPGNISVVMQPKKDEPRTATISVSPSTSGTTTTGDSRTMNVQIKLDSDTINAGDTLKVTVVMVPEGGATATPPPTVDIYIHKDDKDLGQKEAKARRTSDGNFEAETEFKIPDIVKEGQYEVRVVVPPQPGAAATKTVTVNQ